MLAQEQTAYSGISRFLAALGGPGIVFPFFSHRLNFLDDLRSGSGYNVFFHGLGLVPESSSLTGQEAGGRKDKGEARGRG